jgi:hypothetical protein
MPHVCRVRWVMKLTVSALSSLKKSVVDYFDVLHEQQEEVSIFLKDAFLKLVMQGYTKDTASDSVAIASQLRIDA